MMARGVGQVTRATFRDLCVKVRGLFPTDNVGVTQQAGAGIVGRRGIAGMARFALNHSLVIKLVGPPALILVTVGTGSGKVARVQDQGI
jgi:hypothetical protein